VIHNLCNNGNPVPYSHFMRPDITRMNVPLIITFIKLYRVFNQYKNPIGTIKSILKKKQITERELDEQP
tara:strand:+ start:4 stop:210 length:207 start_codon:yes stop_codon:yes gene_type:complete